MDQADPARGKQLNKCEDAKNRESWKLANPAEYTSLHSMSHFHYCPSLTHPPLTHPPLTSTHHIHLSHIHLSHPPLTSTPHTSTSHIHPSHPPSQIHLSHIHPSHPPLTSTPHTPPHTSIPHTSHFPHYSHIHPSLYCCMIQIVRRCLPICTKAEPKIYTYVCTHSKLKDD